MSPQLLLLLLLVVGVGISSCIFCTMFLPLTLQSPLHFFKTLIHIFPLEVILPGRWCHQQLLLLLLARGEGGNFSKHFSLIYLSPPSKAPSIKKKQKKHTYLFFLEVILPDLLLLLLLLAQGGGLIFFRYFSTIYLPQPPKAPSIF